jgi:CRISPR type I-E-associated protein CasB/Cse2
MDNPGARAELRRCRASVDAVGVPMALLLARQIGVTRLDDDDRALDVALGLAILLAHVRESADPKTAVLRAVGYSRIPAPSKNKNSNDPGEERPILSDVRFRRLMDAEPGPELLMTLIRLIRLCDGRMNIADLSEAWWSWHRSSYDRDHIRRRWAMDYYNVRTDRSNLPDSNLAESAGDPE